MADYPENFEIPIQEQQQSVSQVDANEAAFYTSATSNTKTPVEDYEKVSTELTQTGKSELYSIAQAGWKNEQESSMKHVIRGIIEDPSIDFETKKDVLSNYSLGGGISQDLKDKFIEKFGSTHTGITKGEKSAQDRQARQAPALVKQDDKAATESLIFRGARELKDASVGLGVVGADFIKAIPAAIAGVYTLISERDPIAAQQMSMELNEKFRTGQLPKNQEEYRRYIEDKVSILGWAGDKIRRELYNLTGNINTSIYASYYLDPANLVPVGVIVGGGVKVMTAPLRYGYRAAKQLVGIKPGTVAKTAAITNPAMAAEMFTGAILEPTETTAKSMGVSKADLIEDGVMPKGKATIDPNLSPDLAKQLETETLAANAALRENLDEIKLNPTIHDTQLRVKDREIVAKTLSDLEPHLRINASNFDNVTPNVWEGVARFTKDSNYLYDTPSSAIEAFTKIKEAVTEFPEGWANEVFIRDVSTQTLETPQSLNTKAVAQVVDSLESVAKSVSPEAASYFAEAKRDFAKAEELNKEFLTSRNTTPKASEKLASTIAMVTAQATKKLEAGKALLKSAGVTLPDTDMTASVLNKPGQYVVEWKFKRSYNEVDKLIFGDNVVSAKFAGIDVSGIARSSASSWLFNQGTIKGWFSQMSARLAPRQAKQEAMFNRMLSEVASTKFPKEFAKLIEEGTTTGKETFSIVELEQRFPHLSGDRSKIEALYMTHYKSRRLMDAFHIYLNYQKRNELYANKFTKGLYVRGTYTGPVNPDIYFTLLDEERKTIPQTVWDYAEQKEVPFVWNKNKVGDIDPVTGVPVRRTYDINGKQLVALANKQEGIDTFTKYEYALVDDHASQLDFLPQQVVPKTPGYWPRNYKEHFFIEKRPTSLKVNGRPIEDIDIRNTYKEVVAVASNVIEKDKLLDELEQPGYEIVARPARESSFGTVLSEYETQGVQLRHAQQRGEILRGYNRPATMEDPFVVASQQGASLARTGILSLYDEAVQKAFMKDYGRFVNGEMFPTKVEELKAPPGMDEATKIKFDEAVTVYKEYAKNKVFQTQTGDFIKEHLHRLAGIVEKFHIPKGLGLREVANSSESLLVFPRKAASVMSISLHPTRQHIVQLQTLLELSTLTGLKAPKILANAYALRAALAGEADILGNKSLWKKFMTKVGKAASLDMDEVEFTKTINAIKKSGLLESINLNLMVSDMFNPLDRPLTETFAQKAVRVTVAPFKAAVNKSKEVGFEAAESINRIGIWLVAKENWLKRNPGKDWTTAQAIDEIAFDEWSLSGSMSRAGSFAYQQGFISNFFQFQAISHKLFMNVFQDNATRLTAQQRFTLGLARFAMWGSRYGLPTGELIHTYVNGIEDDRLRQALKQMEIGLIDRAVNGTLGLLTGEQSHIAMSESMGSYSKYVLPYFDVWENAAKVWDGKDSTNPRIPVMSAWGTLGDVGNTFFKWFEMKEITADNYKQMLLEAAKVASGGNALAKAMLMKGDRDKRTSLGQPYGLGYSSQEIFFAAFGIKTQQDIAIQELQTIAQERPAVIKAQIETIDKFIVSSLRDNPDDVEQKLAYLSSYITIMNQQGFGDSEINEVLTGVIEKEKMRSKVDVSTSILLKMLQQRTEKSNPEFTQGYNLIKDVFKNDPKAKEVINIVEGSKNNGE